MNTLLVVDDEILTADLLRRYFELAGYDVLSAQTGAHAIKMAVHHQPQVIILDIMLPDTDGYAVCKKLRGDERTKCIPIVFLTQKDSRRDRLDGLELGADDYLTKPFDIEELRLRVQNILDKLGDPVDMPLVDPKTSLPNLDLIAERLPDLLAESESAFVDVQLKQLTDFSAKYGPAAAQQAIRTTAKLIGDLLHEIDPDRTFIGHPREDHFLLGLPHRSLGLLQVELPARFGRQVAKFYDYADQRRGSMKLGFEDVPFMSLKMVRVKAGALRVLVAKHQRERRPQVPLRLAAGSRPRQQKPVSGDGSGVVVLRARRRHQSGGGSSSSSSS